MSDSSTVVAFEGGLDMVTPVQNSAPGTLVDCLNYEVGPIKGYRRIDGYERFDGGLGGGISNLYRVEFTVDDPPEDPEVGSIISLDAKKVGLITAVEAPYTYYVPYSPGVLITEGFTYSVKTPAGTFVAGEAQSPSQDVRLTSADYDEYIELIRSTSAALRAEVDLAPGPVVGVYFGREVAYAVIDSPVWDMSSTSPHVYEGQLVRFNGKAYEVVYQWDAGTITYLAELPEEQSYISSDFEIISYSQYITGTGNLDVVTGAQVLDSPYSYAQPYIVNDGYIPLTPTKYVAFSAADAEFGDTVVLDDGTQWAEYTVEGYQIDSGSVSTMDAAGILYLGSIVNVSANFVGRFTGTITVQNSDTTTDIAAVDEISTALWAGSGALRPNATKAEQTFYQWGTYNFLATRGHERVYATSGAGRAGWIESSTTSGHYGNIFTSADDGVDIPRYLAFHAGQRLLLAFANGSIQLSAVRQPLNFSGLDGAVEIGNGDNITGVLEAQGDSSIIFGPRTVRRLVGLGTSLALNTLSSESGAFDYTCSTVAGMPLYVNHNGLCTLEQTAAYGDFKNASISGSIDPFFTPRIIQDAYSVELGGTICAFPVRSKNQYRVFLGDGSVVSMALTTTGPQPMLSNYAPAGGDLRIPLAYSSSVSDAGGEYVLCVWDVVRAAEAPLPQDDPPAENIIYRLDHGWGFDGATFEHYIDTSYMFNQNPDFLSIDRAILYGMGYGVASLRLRASGVEDTFSQDFDTTVQDISMPRNPEILYKSLGRVMGNVDHANWGRAIKLRFQNITDAGDAATEPPHILQSIRLFVQTQGIPEN